MKIAELYSQNLWEMSNYGTRITGLPSNIKIWLRTESNQLPHSNYRIKVDKNEEFSAIFTILDTPKIEEESHRNKLTKREKRIIVNFIIKYRSLLISHIDGALDSGEFALELTRARNT